MNASFNPKSKIQNLKSFTLIELLVVVAIIAVLIAIMLPALNQARKAAWFATCGSKLRQFHMAYTYYTNESQDRTLKSWPWTTGYATTALLKKLAIRSTIDSYFKIPDVAYANLDTAARNLWLCPADEGGRIFDTYGKSSYTYEWYTLCRDYKQVYTGYYDPKVLMSRPLSFFDQPTRTYLFGHEWMATGEVPYLYDRAMGIYYPHKNYSNEISTGCFAVYLDGHVQVKDWMTSQAEAAIMTNYYTSK